MTTSKTGEIQLASAFGLSARLSLGLRGGTSTLILDARRRASFDEKPWSIPSAVPILMDDDPVQLPDIDRDSAILVICQCQTQASSIRVARWLIQLGYRYVWVLEGGLDAYSGARERIAGISPDDRSGVFRWTPAPVDSRPKALLAEAAIPAAGDTRVRSMAVLFIDMVDFTTLVTRDGPETALALVQRFMHCVGSVAQSHCGDVRDFEGDGAFIYFASPREALPAAYELRKRLNVLRRTSPDLPLSRISIDYGPVLIGPIESERKAIAFIGAPVVTAARLLKIAGPEGIIVTRGVVDYARSQMDGSGFKFAAHHPSIELKGFPYRVEAYEDSSRG